MSKKIMLIDESAFNLSPDTLRDEEADARFIAFLQDARFEFDIIVVTNNSSETLKTNLNYINFSKAFIDDKKIDQSFLTQDVRNWRDITLNHVDVVMTHKNDLPENCPNPDLVIASGCTYGPNSFYYWMKGYEDNVSLDGGFRAMQAIKTSLLTHEEETNRLLTTIYGDTEKVWNKIKSKPEIIKLTGVFSSVNKKAWETQSAEELVLEHLHGYFDYTVRKWYAPDTTKDVEGNLNAYKEGLQQDFRNHNIDGKYPEEKPSEDLLFKNRKEYERQSHKAFKAWKNLPISDEHTRLINNALQAIEHVVETEPAQVQFN